MILHFYSIFNSLLSKFSSPDSYRVGQNIAYKQWSCRKNDCRTSEKRHPRDWAVIIKIFTDEINVFHKDLVKSMQFKDGEAYGHLTQVSDLFSITISKFKK